MLNIKMVKLYTICLDAFPETNHLSTYLTSQGLKKSNLVCSGAFTCATMTSMISGTLGSEIIPGGIGYSTNYLPHFFTWRETGNCLIDVLREKILINIHNHIAWMSHNIIGKKLSEDNTKKHYRDHNVVDHGITTLENCVVSKKEDNIIYSSTHPDLSLSTFIEWNNLERKKIFYENEKKYIKLIQSIQDDLLFWNDLSQWHESVYYFKDEANAMEKMKNDSLVDMVEWLKNWDFNEPDSVFFIYADHSHRVKQYLDPAAYFTWVYFKDNRKILSLNETIASSDFYHLALRVFGFPPVYRSKWSQDPTIPTINRIFGCEDGRSNAIVKTKANTFLRGCIYQDYWISVAKYFDFVYLIIAKLSNIHSYSAYKFINGEFMDPIKKFSIVCHGPLDHRTKKSTVMPLTPELIAKAKILFAALTW